MILFHGTSSKFLRGIMRHGIRPRSLTGKSTYDGKLLSDEARVYLTDIYAVQFGLIACEHGGNLLIVAAQVDAIEPDTDFMDDGLHHRKFTSGEECLKSTGCCSVVGSVPAKRIWQASKKITDLVREQGSHRIETGIRHDAFRKMHQEQLDYVLYESRRYILRDGEWWDEHKERFALQP